MITVAGAKVSVVGAAGGATVLGGVVAVGVAGVTSVGGGATGSGELLLFLPQAPITNTHDRPTKTRLNELIEKDTLASLATHFNGQPISDSDFYIYYELKSNYYYNHKISKITTTSWPLSQNDISANIAVT